MPSSLNPYLHGLFAILLYLVGNFFTIVILEYKLKNVNLKHTIAGFACVAISGLIVYLVPVFFLGITSPLMMQTVGLISACLVQIIFWWLWFKQNLRKFAPVLVIAFVLSVVVALIAYNLFVWYINTIARDAVFGVVKGVADQVQTLF